MKAPFVVLTLSASLLCAAAFAQDVTRSEDRSDSGTITGGTASPPPIGTYSSGNENADSAGASTSGASGNLRLPTFEGLDANHDGVIDRAEAQRDPQLYTNFSKYDKSHTGKLNRGEFNEYLHDAGATPGERQ